MIDFRSIRISPTHPNRCVSQDEAQGMPLWDNPLFKVTHRSHIKSWKSTLKMVRVRDTMDKERKDTYYDEDVVNMIKDKLRLAGSNAVHSTGGKVVTLRAVLNQWHRLIDSIPRYITLTAHGVTQVEYQKYGMGAILLRGMGWRAGQGIGKTPGVTEPIPDPVGTRGKAGVGSNATKLPRRKLIAQKRKVYKATRWEGEIIYGKYNAEAQVFTQYALNTRGKPVPTHTTRMVHPDKVTEVLWWGNAIVGAAPISFPHPEGWRVEGPDCTLSRVTVKSLTLALTLRRTTNPPCMSYWNKRLGPIDWQAVGRKYREKLITPKDFMPHFKNILHRALLTRNRQKDRIARLATNCRLCRRRTENIIHLADCAALWTLWERFLELVPERPRDPQGRRKLILLGLTTPELPKPFSDFHLVLWKFILIHFTLTDIENRNFDSTTVWEGAVRRYASKVNSLNYQVLEEAKTAEAEEREPHLMKVNSLIEPLAHYDAQARLTWRPDFLKHVEAATSRGGAAPVQP